MFLALADEVVQEIDTRSKFVHAGEGNGGPHDEAMARLTFSVTDADLSPVVGVHQLIVAEEWRYISSAGVRLMRSVALDDLQGGLCQSCVHTTGK